MTVKSEKEGIKQGIRQFEHDRVKLSDITAIVESGGEVPKKDMLWLIRLVHEYMQDRKHEIF